MGNVEQQFHRYQQQIVEGKQEQGRQHQKEHHPPPVVEKGRIAAPQPQPDITHSQPHAIEQQHHSYKGLGCQQPVLMAQRNVGKAHQEEIGKASQSGIQQDVPNV